jgi:hypothetical protein
MTTPPKGKKYSAPCAWGCGTTVWSRRRIPAGGIGCGQGECGRKHNEAATQYQAELRARRSAAARAAHARRNEPVKAWGDWGQLVALSVKGEDR